MAHTHLSPENPPATRHAWWLAHQDAQAGDDCSRPKPTMQAVRDILRAASHDIAHSHEESFATPVHCACAARLHRQDVRAGGVLAWCSRPLVQVVLDG